MRYPVIAASMLAIVASNSSFAQDKPAADAHIGAQVDAGNIMPKLVGRVWGNRYSLAKVEQEADGRYRLQYGYAVHRINVSNPAAPTTKSSFGGTVLLESDFVSTPNSFVLTGTSRAKHKSYFWVMPNGSLRHLFMWQSDGVYKFGSLTELAPSDGTSKNMDVAVVANFYGKKQIAAAEAYLGVSLADVDQLKSTAKLGSAPVQQAAANAPAPARTVGTSPLAKAITAMSATSAAPASPPARTPVAATGAVDPRRWGMLATLAGSSWADSELVVDYEWLTPNAALLIRDRGISGSSEVLVTPAADGKSLNYQRNEPDLRKTFSGTALPSTSRFAWYSDTDGRSLCKVKKNQMTCDSTGGGASWQRIMTPITRAAGDARIAALPADFPGRPKGWFDAKFGLFADLAAGRWELTHTKQNGKWTKTPGGLALEVGAGNANGGGAVIHIASSLSRKKSLFFKEGQDGKFYTTVSAADHKNPEGRSSVQMWFRDSGRAQYCFFLKYEGTVCNALSMSRDGKQMLFSEGNAQYILTHTPAPVIKPGKFGLMGKLNGQSFQASSGEVQTYTVYANASGEATAVSQAFTGRGDDSTFCGTNATAQAMDCSAHRTNRRGDSYTDKYSVTFSAANSREFTRDGRVYRLTPEGDLSASNSNGAPTIYRRIKWGDLRYMEQAKDDNDQIRYAYNDRKSRAADKAAFWNGIAAGVANLSNTLADYNRQNAFMAPVNWSARIGSASSAQAGVPGYNSSMGTIVRTEAPRMSLADQYRADELERFKIREKMYGSGRGTAAAPAERPYAKAYEQLARDRAANEARAAEQDRADAVAASEQRQRDAAATAETARQQAESDRRVAEVEARRKAAADAAKAAAAQRAKAAAAANNSSSSSGNGLIVSDDSAERARRAEQDKRIAAENEARAAAERARAAAMVAQQEREAAALAKKREEDRIRALIKCHGSLEAAKKAKATCA